MDSAHWHTRIRWRNVAKLAAALAVVALVAASPLLASHPPAVPSGAPEPLAPAPVGAAASGRLDDRANPVRPVERTHPVERARPAERRRRAKPRRHAAKRHRARTQRAAVHLPRTPAPSVAPPVPVLVPPAYRPAPAPSEFVFG